MPHDFLHGWKSIANYLQRDERTVRRWEKQHGLPVHRIAADGRKSSVYAIPSELKSWLLHPRVPDFESETGKSAAEIGPSIATSSPPTRTGPTRRKLYAFTGILLILTLTTSILLMWVWQGYRVTEAMPPTYANEGQSEDLFEAELLFQTRTAGSLQRAAAIYSEHIHQDSHSAAAYAGLAKTYCLLREYSPMPSSDAYVLAKKAAEQALTLDPNNADAHAVLGFVSYFRDWAPRAAEWHFQDAIRLAPASALPRQWYGSMLMHEGNIEAALQQLDTAQRLAPSSVAVASTRALALSLAGKRGQAIQLLENLEEYFPEAPAPHRALAYISLQEPRRPERFLSESARFAALRGDKTRADEINSAEAIYQSDGETAMWRYLLARERQRSDHAHPSVSIAQMEAILGEEKAAVRDSIALVREHSEDAIALAIDPALANLRNAGKLDAVLHGIPGR